MKPTFLQNLVLLVQKKNVIYLMLLHQISDSSQRKKKVSLDLIKLERYFKPTGGRKQESHSSNEMFPSSESFIQINNTHEKITRF